MSVSNTRPPGARLHNGAVTDEKPRTDYGRWIALTIFTLLLLAVLLLLLTDPTVWDSVPGAASRILVVAFYGLLVLAYARRARAEASDHHPLAWTAAFAATLAPFAIPLLGGDGEAGSARATVAALVLVVGQAFMVWGLLNLGSSISLIPQARRVVQSGPYALVRHPLYTAEIVSTTGACLAYPGTLPWLVLAAFVAIQFFRARREEALLIATLPGYAEYRASTPMLVPRPRRVVAD